MIQLLDHGYVKLIETWGSDERIIEAARTSTDKGFKGWGRFDCLKCGVQIEGLNDGTHDDDNPDGVYCGGELIYKDGDEKLLAYLYNNRHMTPFEMAGAIFEIKAPIFVFREWHRHRTQSYNEMSARYIPLPDENYMPTMPRIMQTSQANKQAASVVTLDARAAADWLVHLDNLYRHAQGVYEMGLNAGVPKELARLAVLVARYSRMRASANLRNWMAFCELRDSKHAPGAQWEIRQFADTVGTMLSQNFPRTMALFNAEKS
jgi:thymidylate synthase (FAD)